MTKRDVLAIAEKMALLPKKDDLDREVGTKETVGLLRKQINGLRKKGWSFEEIARYLTEEGIPIKKSTLESYHTRKGETGSTTGADAAPKPPRTAKQDSEGSQGNGKANADGSTHGRRTTIAVKSDPALS